MPPGMGITGLFGVTWIPVTRGVPILSLAPPAIHCLSTNAWLSPGSISLPPTCGTIPSGLVSIIESIGEVGLIRRPAKSSLRLRTS